MIILFLSFSFSFFLYLTLLTFGLKKIDFKFHEAQYISAFRLILKYLSLSISRIKINAASLCDCPWPVNVFAEKWNNRFKRSCSRNARYSVYPSNKVKITPMLERIGVKGRFSLIVKWSNTLSPLSPLYTLANSVWYILHPFYKHHTMMC